MARRRRRSGARLAEIGPAHQLVAAREEKNWSPEISSAFWVAYSALCDLLKPVTIDTIEASRSKIQAHKFIFFGPLRTISLTQRTARRYLILLLVLLVISTVSGFIVSVSNSLSTEIKALVGDGDTYVTQTAAGLSSIEVDLDELANANENPLQISLEDARIKPEVRTKIDGLRSRLQDLYYVQDRMHQKVKTIFWITIFSQLPIPQEISVAFRYSRTALTMSRAITWNAVP